MFNREVFLENFSACVELIIPRIAFAVSFLLTVLQVGPRCSFVHVETGRQAMARGIQNRFLVALGESAER